MAKAELDDLSTTLNRCYRPLECFACHFFVYVGSRQRRFVADVGRWRAMISRRLETWSFS